MYKTAEVRGVLAAFCDAGLVKVASAEAFDDLTEKVALCLNDYYTVDDVADATSFVVKTASDGDFLGSAKNRLSKYFLKDLGFGDVADNYREYGRLESVHNGKVADAQRRLNKLKERDALSPKNQQVGKNFYKDLESTLKSAKLEREKALSGMRGTMGKSLLKALGKASVPALALYGGGKLLGKLFGSDEPRYG